MEYLGGFKVFDADAVEIENLIDWNNESFGRGVSLPVDYEIFQEGADVIIYVYGNKLSAVDAIISWVEDEGYEVFGV